jgi:hypothetical protein
MFSICWASARGSKCVHDDSERWTIEVDTELIPDAVDRGLHPRISRPLFFKYSATGPLSGRVPLRRKASIIDYIIVSQGNGGLSGEEIIGEPAKIHTELLEGIEAEDFRRQGSDHLPVSVEIAVVPDND